MPRYDSVTRLGLAALVCAALSACATSRTAEEQELATAMEARATIVPAGQAERQAIRTQDLLTQAAFWAEQHDLNPGDREAAIEFVRILRALGNEQRASDVARQSMALYPDDADLLYLYGLSLTTSGRGGTAIEPLSRARAARPGDWRIINALGVAYEVAGLSEEARNRFREALAIAPGEAAILSNLALSYAMGGQAEQAEIMLREAIARPGAGAQVRQNLALVIALQGRFDEAERLARTDVSVETAEANMAYVRSMLTTQRRWDAIRGDGAR
ncbi:MULTISPECIES: tetratricopeptide repeat protein [Hyphobacterium]|uniref:Tetratricopeptide repeat protein n=1 Tax=Hyphobacterium vulgare TaxID=1736751 RepID=A0ABV6ZV87_9PROT